MREKLKNARTGLVDCEGRARVDCGCCSEMVSLSLRSLCFASGYGEHCAADGRVCELAWMMVVDDMSAALFVECHGAAGGHREPQAPAFA